jgi:hypothetical protein
MNKVISFFKFGRGALDYSLGYTDKQIREYIKGINATREEKKLPDPITCEHGYVFEMCPVKGCTFNTGR